MDQVDQFQAAKRRREADGKCEEKIRLAIHRVWREGQELLAVVAKVRQAVRLSRCLNAIRASSKEILIGRNGNKGKPRLISFHGNHE